MIKGTRPMTIEGKANLIAQVARWYERYSAIAEAQAGLRFMRSEGDRRGWSMKEEESRGEKHLSKSRVLCAHLWVMRVQMTRLLQILPSKSYEVVT